MQTLHGMGVSPGIAIGRAVSIVTRVGEVYRFHLEEVEVAGEVARFDEAVRHAQNELQRLRARAGEDLGQELAAIFDAHILLLKDSFFLGRVINRIREQRVNAEWALHETAAELDERFASMDDMYLRERSEDLTDVSRHVLRSLQGIDHHEISEIDDDVIIVADDLTPSDAIRLGRKHVVGFAIESGGRTSHTTIIARSLNLPAVAGVEGVSRVIIGDDPIILDGDAGLVILDPTSDVVERYRHRQRELKRREQDMLEIRDLEAVTRDGVHIYLMANIDLPEEVGDMAAFGAEGIGLYRSEFLYIEKSPDLPTEDEHVAIYRQLVEAAAPHPAIIRTYDLGGRKLAREVMATHEDNPVLGMRGIRLVLARPDIFKTQVRALLRAGLYGDLWVMLPLISTLDEVHRFRALLDEARGELKDEGIPFSHGVRLGIMIEVPAAATIADHLARAVEFFSIGTNDLVQYSLAVDRNNEHVADLYQPLHPAILRMLRFVIDSARAAGIEVGICGEMAGDLRSSALLVGLGLRRLSMSPRTIPEVKARLRTLSTVELAEVAVRCLELRTAAEVQQYLDCALELGVAEQMSRNTVLS